MTNAKKIPGTTIFDGGQAQKGYALNAMCYSFNSLENRNRFKGDEEAYMAEYKLPNCKHYFDPTKVRSNQECGLHTQSS